MWDAQLAVWSGSESFAQSRLSRDLLFLCGEMHGEYAGNLLKPILTISILM